MTNARNPSFVNQTNNTNYAPSSNEERGNHSADNTSIPLIRLAITTLYNHDPHSSLSAYPYPNSNVGIYNVSYYLSCYRCQMIINPGSSNYVSCVSCSRVTCSLCRSNDFSADQRTFTCEYCCLGAAMVEWLRCSTRIHKVLCSNLSITIHGMTLDKSLTVQLS